MNRSPLWDTAHHEARHIVVAEALGATDLTGHVGTAGEGGYFTGMFDGSPENEAVILMAGGGTRNGSSFAGMLPHGGDSDLKQAERLLRGSDMTVADAQREAGRLVSRHRGEIRRRARRLLDGA